MRVVVLERREVLGGAAVTEEIVPGFRFSVASYVVSLLRPEIIRDLDLAAHGLQILPLDGTFTPLDDDYLWRVERPRHDVPRAAPLVAVRRRGVRGVRPADGAHGALHQADPVGRAARPGPHPPARSGSRWARWPRSFAELPRRLRDTFIQVMTMSAADFLDQWFETDPLKATMSASGIIGTFQGVRSPGTAYVLLHHYMGEIDGAFRAWGIPKGGTGGVSLAIASAAESLGAEIRTEASVARIDAADGRVAGVTLESGEELLADVVLSSADSRVTFERLLEPGVLDDEFLTDVRRYKFRGSSAKVNLALDGLPEFSCLPGRGEHLRGAISFSPSVDYMERAYDDAKYGRPSRRPYIDMIIPTLVDPRHGAARPAHDELLRPVRARTTWPTARSGTTPLATRFGETVLDTIEERAPGIRKLIIGKQVLTPLDIERRIGLSEGNIFQGELSLEQLFFNRPVPGLRALPHAGRRAVDVRLGRAPRRRADGRARPDRGARAAGRAPRGRWRS